jgi:hypothetical protein
MRGAEADQVGLLPAYLGMTYHEATKPAAVGSNSTAPHPSTVFRKKRAELRSRRVPAFGWAARWAGCFTLIKRKTNFSIKA